MFRGFAAPALDGRVVAVAGLLALLGTGLAGLAATRRVRRRDVTTLLQASARSVGRRRFGGGVLMTIETALAIVLVAGAAVTIRSFAGLVLKHPGFVADDLYVLQTSAGWRQRWPIAESWRDDRAPAVLDEVRMTPGVVWAGAGTGVPTEGNAGAGAFWRARGLPGQEFGVTAGYFDALGTQIRHGRVISDHDVAAVADVAVVTETGARTLWPSHPVGTAVGRMFTYLDGSSKVIVGVVADFSRRPGASAVPVLFLPFGSKGLQATSSNIYVTLRMAPAHRLDTADVLRRVQSRLGGGAGGSIVHVPDTLTPWLQQPRFQAALFGSLAAVALVIACVGLFALTTFEMARRTFEMGVRLSLGATPRQLRRLVIAWALRPVLIGACAGLAVTWWAARFLQSFVFEVDARDFWTYAVVAFVLVITAVVASWLPARRAARTDPTLVLRAT
jgi:hypothetical protein